MVNLPRALLYLGGLLTAFSLGWRMGAWAQRTIPRERPRKVEDTDAAV